MFDRKQQIQVLRRRNEKLTEQNAELKRDLDDAVSLTARQASEITRLRNVAATWARLSRVDRRRSLRLANAAIRYWAEIGRLRRQLRAQQRDAAERISKLEGRLAVLQEANEAGYQKLFDRSSPPIAA